MNQGKPQPGERIGVIDELRGLALVMVVLSHVGLVYGLETDIAYCLALPAFGVGVDLFLVISGFVIYRNVLAMSVKAGGNARARRASVLDAAVRADRGACRSDPRSGRSSSAGAGRPWSVLGRSRCGSRVLRQFLLGRLRGERGPLPASVGRLAFLESIARSTILCVRACAHRPAPASGLVGLLGVLAMGAGLERPVGSYLWTTRPDALFIGMGVAALREQAVAPRKLWPSLSLGQAVYWACIASLIERLAVGRFSGLGLTFIALLFGFVLAGRMGVDAGASWPARALRKGGELSFSAYLVHLPVMSGVHAALAERTTPALSLLISLLAIAAATLIWDALVVAPAARFGRRLSETWIQLNCEAGADGRNLSRQFIRKRRTECE